MYVLEIETKNHLKKIENPRKARIRDWIFLSILQIMNDDGEWKTVCICEYIPVANTERITNKINKAIRQKQPSVYVEI